MLGTAVRFRASVRLASDPVTLFEVRTPRVRRARKPVPRGREKPKWAKYDAKVRRRCAECEIVSFEAMPGPAPVIAQARFSRRQDGVTVLYCAAHANDQRDEDRATYKEDT